MAYQPDDPIPRFHGDGNWMDFAELFNAHPWNKHLPDGQKMSKLFLYVWGAAEDYYHLQRFMSDVRRIGQQDNRMFRYEP